MARSEGKLAGWFPMRGSWEESVLTWNEQIDLAVRRTRGILSVHRPKSASLTLEEGSRQERDSTTVNPG
jgi:hypothetical protein